jgi:hypothetical protein
MTNSKLLALLIAAATTLSIPANADMMTLTFTGTVSTENYNGLTGIDYQGLFGPRGASLFGDPATVTYVVDAPYGTTSSSIPLSTTITINGVTQSFGSGTNGYARTKPYNVPIFPSDPSSPRYQTHMQVVNELLPNFNLQMWDYSLGYTMPDKITTNYEYDFNPLIDNPSNGILKAGVGGLISINGGIEDWYIDTTHVSFVDPDTSDHFVPPTPVPGPAVGSACRDC